MNHICCTWAGCIKSEWQSWHSRDIAEIFESSSADWDVKFQFGDHVAPVKLQQDRHKTLSKILQWCEEQRNISQTLQVHVQDQMWMANRTGRSSVSSLHLSGSCQHYFHLAKYLCTGTDLSSYRSWLLKCNDKPLTFTHLKKKR